MINRSTQMQCILTMKERSATLLTLVDGDSFVCLVAKGGGILYKGYQSQKCIVLKALVSAIKIHVTSAIQL